MSNFQALEVVGRGSETLLRVVENLNYLVFKHQDFFFLLPNLTSNF